MSDQQNGANASTPTGEQTTSQQQQPEPKTQAPDADKPRVKADDLPPDALKARLEQAELAGQRKLLQQWGVTDAKDVGAALAELQKRQEAEKSELERVQGERDQLAAKASKADVYLETLARRAAAELADLDESTRKTIVELAGDDPAQQVAVIDKMRAGGLLEKQSAPANQDASKPKVPDTSPGASAPQDTSTPPTNHKVVYEEMREKNPFAAARYLAAYQADIYPPSQ